MDIANVRRSLLLNSSVEDLQFLFCVMETVYDQTL